MLFSSLAVLATSALTLVSGSYNSTLENTPCGIDGGTFCESEGFVCKLVDQQSQCVQDNTHYLSKRQSIAITRIVGVQGAGVRERVSIEFMQSQQPDTFNIFMYALSVMQAVSESNPLSYYQIAGIHGRPFQPWQEAMTSSMDPGTGYCTHSSALFPTWHRPYLALIEQRIYAHCVQVANRFASGPIRTRYLNAATLFRLPYWDWASLAGQSSIPSIVRTARITITMASSQGQPVQTTIPNPLYQYTFTDSNLRNRNFAGVFRNMAATRRYPPANGGSSRNNDADQNMRNTFLSRRQNTYNLFSLPNFNAFSNSDFQAGNTPNAWLSVESIHNEVHSAVGGDRGHMSLVDYSAFDPIFWLHHCNIDRLVAMYQAIYPDRDLLPQQARGTFARRVRSGDIDDINTPLRPFRNSQGNYFTSVELSSASSIWNLGYAYPEVPARFTSNASGLRTFTTTEVNRLYASAASRKLFKRQDGQEGVKRRQWICHVAFDPSEIQGTGGSPECLVFLGMPSQDPNTRKSEPNLVGSASALKKQSTGDSGMASQRITSCVPLTESIEQAGIDINDATLVVPFLQNGLAWTMQLGSEKIPVENVPSLIVGVSSAIVTYGSPESLPVWGEFETFYEITQNKQGGMTPEQKNIVKSIDITHVSANFSSSRSMQSTTEFFKSLKGFKGLNLAKLGNQKFAVDQVINASRKAAHAVLPRDSENGHGLDSAKTSEYDNHKSESKKSQSCAAGKSRQ